MKEIIHPHNDVLQSIDIKIKRLLQTYEYITECHKKLVANVITRKESDKWFKEIKERINRLKVTRNLLLEFGVDNSLLIENIQ